MKRRIRKKAIGLIVLVISIIILIIIFCPKEPKSVVTTKSGTSAPAISINYTNMAKELSKQGMIKAMPEDQTILLEFYNFNSGSREVEKTYTLRKGKVTEEKVSNPGIILSLHSKYLKGLTNKNFCKVIQKANKAGDLGFESSFSEASLAWKFRSMMKYKDCLGL